MKQRITLEQKRQIVREYEKSHSVKELYQKYGIAYDNAAAESFFSVLKREEISHNCVHYTGRTQEVVNEYIEFYNTKKRILNWVR